jgi:eukaryotic-like serine/threonine-protein kinase
VHRSSVDSIEVTRVLPVVRLPARYAGAVLIARGGMAEVYRATDTELDRMVAVKVLDERYSGDDELARRFEREALAAGRLSGEAHTVTTYDVGVCNGRPFIVMEYLAGGSLADVLRATGAQPPAQALRWLKDAAAALDHAHSRGVVHRDVKPANLLLSDDGRLHVADFGVASATGAAPMTMAGTVFGTAGYLAPEETEGKPATPASDRYALGVVAFELLTGERPFQRDSVTADVAAHGSAPIPAASTRDRKLPSTLDPVFARALAKDPGSRFVTCSAFVDALRDAFASTTATRIVPTAVTARRRFGRARYAAMLALLCAVGALAAVFAVDRGPSTPKPHATAPAGPPATAAVVRRVQTPPPAGRERQAQTLVGLAMAAISAGSCDGVVPLLDRAVSLGGDQPRIDELRALCTGPPGHRFGHGHRHVHGHGPDGGDEGG